MEQYDGISVDIGREPSQPYSYTTQVNTKAEWFPSDSVVVARLSLSMLHYGLGVVKSVDWSALPLQRKDDLNSLH